MTLPESEFGAPSGLIGEPDIARCSDRADAGPATQDEGALVPAEAAKYCARCDQAKPIADFFRAKKGRLRLAGYCKPCSRSYRLERYSTVQSLYDKNKRDRLKEEFLAAYGGKCACCGEVNPAFLTVDHTNNDGETHRKSIAPQKKRGGNTSEVLRALRKEGWPNYVRILCFNCNFGRRGKSDCPHRLNQ